MQNYTEVFNSIIVVVSNEIWKGIFDGVEQSWNTASMNFAAADPYKAEQDIMHILIEAGLPTGNLYNVQKYTDRRNIVTIISIFSYGFIVLISL